MPQKGIRGLLSGLLFRHWLGVRKDEAFRFGVRSGKYRETSLSSRVFPRSLPSLAFIVALLSHDWLQSESQLSEFPLLISVSIEWKTEPGDKAASPNKGYSHEFCSRFRVSARRRRCQIGLRFLCKAGLSATLLKNTFSVSKEDQKEFNIKTIFTQIKRMETSELSVVGYSSMQKAERLSSHYRYALPLSIC